MKRKFPRFLSTQVSRFFSINSLLKIQTPIFLPFYHVVSDDSLPHILNYNYRNVEQFEKELDFYLKHFKPVSLKEINPNTNSAEKVFHLSFDDGLKECAEIIAPILLKKGIPATFFVNTGFLDNRALFHKYKASLLFRQLEKSPNSAATKKLKENNLEGIKILQATIQQVKLLDEIAEMGGVDFSEFLQKQKPYLTTGQLIQLQEQGFSIGAHSVNHPEFWLIPEEEQLNEIKLSVNWLDENITPTLKTFSFPYSDFGVSKKVIDTLKKENICDIIFGTAGIKYDEADNLLQRYAVEQEGDFIQNLKSELVYFKIRKQIGKATVTH